MTQESGRISSGKVVSIHYTLSNEDGEVLDSSADQAPLEYLHGASNIVPGLERQLEGHGPGDRLQVEVAPGEGYGEYDPEGVQVIPRAEFPAELDLQPGMRFNAEDPQGNLIPVWVAGASGEEVTVDLNHPLAGETLRFDVTVVAVRESTAEERLHGHPHGPGGHSG